MRDLRLCCVVVAAILTMAGGEARAQQRTSATYDDWVLQCDTQAGPPPQKVCEISQVTQVQGKGTPFSRVVVQHPVKGKLTKLVIQLPVNVSLATSVRIQTSDADPGVMAPYVRCVPAGCFAELDIRDDVLKRLRAITGSGKFTFKDAAGQDIAIPLSFKGFDPALDALAKE
jgi:invasion protein IalB